MFFKFQKKRLSVQVFIVKVLIANLKPQKWALWPRFSGFCLLNLP